MSTILLIEDEQALAATLARSLRKAGHDVTVTSGKNLTQIKLATGHPDLVLTDIARRRKEGIKAIRAMRKINPAMPIIAMSSCGRRMNEAFLSAAEHAGVTEILRSPIAEDVLVWVVERNLRQP